MNRKSYLSSYAKWEKFIRKKKYRIAVCRMLLWITTPFAMIAYFMAFPAFGIHNLRIWLNDGIDPD